MKWQSSANFSIGLVIHYSKRAVDLWLVREQGEGNWLNSPLLILDIFPTCE